MEKFGKIPNGKRIFFSLISVESFVERFSFKPRRKSSRNLFSSEVQNKTLRETSRSLFHVMEFHFSLGRFCSRVLLIVLFVLVRVWFVENVCRDFSLFGNAKKHDWKSSSSSSKAEEGIRGLEFPSSGFYREQKSILPQDGSSSFRWGFVAICKEYFVAESVKRPIKSSRIW